MLSINTNAYRVLQLITGQDAGVPPSEIGIHQEDVMIGQQNRLPSNAVAFGRAQDRFGHLSGRKRGRRGITLLFVIGLITLFVLLGVTFMVVATNYMRGARVTTFANVQRQSPKDQTRSAMYQLLRGTNDLESSVFMHDLMSDMYDVTGFKGIVNAAYVDDDPSTTLDDAHFNLQFATTAGSIFVLQLEDSTTSADDATAIQYLDGTIAGLSNTTGAYNGQILTFLNGPASGISVRIVDYLVHIHPDFATTDASAPLVRQFVLRPENGDFPIAAFQNPSPTLVNGGLVGGTVLINAKPFNGRGAGIDANVVPPPGMAQMNRDALLPNRRIYYRNSVPSIFAGVAPRDSQRFYYGNGFTNESYDAVDHQNMMLGAKITETGAIQVLPSFHRPGLVNYWMQNSTSDQDGTPNDNPLINDPADYAPFFPNDQTAWDFANSYPLSYREFRRQVIMRPMPWDHPNFDGGNLNLAAQDLNGDGTPFLVGADGGWGFAGRDDDGLNGTDDIGEAGWEGSDDILENDGALLDLLAGNLGFDLWDVDNDGDLIPDSVWVDMGFSPEVDETGRYYKPLVAVLALDMDGRFNINAHGTQFHDDDFAYSALFPRDLAGGFQTNNPNLPRGDGYGPPEINMRGLFTDNDDYKRLLYGWSGGTSPAADRLLGLMGRYGYDENGAGAAMAPPVPGTFVVDQVSAWKFYDYPNVGNPMLGGSFSGTHDLQGRLAHGIDGFGQPAYDQVNTAVRPSEVSNSPYEMDLSPDAPTGTSATGFVKDQPYTPQELERILRANDVDSNSLADRLWRLSNTLQTDIGNSRSLVTTDSYDVPVPPDATLQFMEVRTSVNNTTTVQLTDRKLVDHLRVLLETYGNTLVSNGATNQQATIAVNDLIRGNPNPAALAPSYLAPELLKGTKMNANRKFGDGFDDNTNGIVDEHWHSTDQNVNEAEVNNEDVFTTLTLVDHDNDGLLPGSDAGDTGYLARANYARHLFILLMMCRDEELQLDFDGDGDPQTDGFDETPLVLAQWCINAVDFKDSDSINTPFEFDIEPFDDDGWAVDGNITTIEATTDRFVVWGAERPELLLTEAYAMHDRRIEDLATPDNETTDGSNPDNDFDQRLRPRGAAFVELFNPWRYDGLNVFTSKPPAELYSFTGNDPVNGTPLGVDLRRVTPNNGDPVWRIMVANGTHDQVRDLELTLGNSTNSPFWLNENLIERVIYFDTAGGYGGTPGTAREHVLTNEIYDALNPVTPLGYAVVGSAGQRVSADEYYSPMGRKQTATETDQASLLYNETRAIMLDPGDAVEIRQPDPTSADPSLPGSLLVERRNSMAVPVPDFSISEPVAGYPAANFSAAAVGGEGEYAPAEDEPFDTARTDVRLGNVFVQDQTVESYRTFHLQRLANPLEDWHAEFNPYLTIDTMSSELTIFNGVENYNYGAPLPIADGSYRTETLERGSDEEGIADTTQWRNLWTHEPPFANAPSAATEANTQLVTPDGHYFSFNLLESFAEYDGSGAPIVSDAFAAPRTDPARYSMAPANTIAFPEFAWNNRPYISQYELMLVPKSSQAGMLYEFNIGIPAGTFDQYGEPFARAGHLLNWFQVEDNFVVPATDLASGLHRLFDFVHVPSRFTGTESWFGSEQMQRLQIYVNGTQQSNAYVGSLPYNAPFNYAPLFREPGKVNINTIFNPIIWNGILNGHEGPTYDQLVQTRRGYGPVGGTSLEPTGGSPGNTFPSHVNQPFRDGRAGDVVVNGDPAGPREDVDFTFLRRENVTNNSTQQNPLFDSEYAEAAFPFYATNRNARYREKTRARMGNLVTTRSNVYAVWITMGYFEYDPNTQQLGRELGLDRGDVTRHRAFYIIDRTLPAGYEPGKNHNVDNMILVERYIE